MITPTDDKNIGKGTQVGVNKVCDTMKRNWVRYIEIKRYVYLNPETPLLEI